MREIILIDKEGLKYLVGENYDKLSQAFVEGCTNNFEESLIRFLKNADNATRRYGSPDPGAANNLRWNFLYVAIQGSKDLKQLFSDNKADAQMFIEGFEKSIDPKGTYTEAFHRNKKEIDDCISEHAFENEPSNPKTGGPSF